MADGDVVATVAQLIASSRSLLFVTGAGISADSGLPTYRGVSGLYEREITPEGFPIEEIMSGEMFRRRPELTWKYLWEIGAACFGAEPNFAHCAIANWERDRSVCVLTQNVDGLHRRAGSRNVIEVHGDAAQLECTDCRAEHTAQEVVGGYAGEIALPPRCERCQGILRPDVVLFGEMLPNDVVVAMDNMLEQSFDVVVVIGTSAVFPYIQYPVLLAQQRGKPTVEINPVDSVMSDVVDYRIKMGAVAAMQAITREIYDT